MSEIKDKITFLLEKVPVQQRAELMDEFNDATLDENNPGLICTSTGVAEADEVINAWNDHVIKLRELG